MGLGFDEGLLFAMAEAGGGNFVYAENALVLRNFFAQELQEMLQIASTATTLHLTLPHGVRGELVSCLLYTSDAADDLLCVDLGCRRLIKKTNTTHTTLSSLQISLSALSSTYHYST